MNLGVNGKKRLTSELEDLTLLISVVKTSDNSDSVSLYAVKVFDINYKKNYHERCLP